MMLITCLYIFIQVSGISAVGITEGKEFLISTPSMKLPFNNGTGYPRLVLTVMSSFTVTVKVVTEGLINTTNYLEKELNIRPFQPVKFYDEKLFFGPDLQSGIRWAYHLTGDYSFAVLVSMETNLFVAETFTAVPVSSWGSRYIVTTLDKHSSVVLIAGELRNMLTFTLKLNTHDSTLLVNETERKQGDTFQIELMRYQAYSIDDCVENGSSALTGSSVDGILPFGVVSGNCNGYAQIQKCDSPQDSSGIDVLIGSTVAEMLLPVESLGHQFIPLCMTCHFSRGYVTVLASMGFTRIKYTYFGSSEFVIHLQEKGDWHRQSNDLISLEADKPIYVTYVRYPTCILINEGGPSIMMLIPIELFYFIYKCMVPDTTMRHYIILVINAKFNDSVQAMYFEGEDPILGLTTHHPLDLSFREYMGDFYVLEYEVKRGVSFILYSLATRFGCYVHGQSPNATYMHPAGFISSNINPYVCKNSERTMKMGDFLDNDCDSKVDEEKGKDNDESIRNLTTRTYGDYGFYFKKGDTINAFLSNVPDNMRQEYLSTFHKPYNIPGTVFSKSAQNTTEYDLDGKSISTPAHVFSTSVKNITEYNLENYTIEAKGISTPANVYSTSVKKTMATEYNSENYTTEVTTVFSTRTRKTATTETILENDKTEGTGIGYFLLLVMLLVVIIAVPIYVFITIQNKNTTEQVFRESKASIISMKDVVKSRLSILSQKSIKSVAKESDVQPADPKVSNEELSKVRSETSV